MLLVTHITTGAGRDTDVTGIDIRANAIREVEFVCPHCGVDRDGDVVELQRWLRLGPAWLVPLKRLGPMVQCRSCDHRSGVGILNVPTAKALEELLRTALRYSITTVVRAGRGGGPASDEVDRHAVSIMRGAGYLYDRFDLDDDLRTLTDSGTTPHLRPLADELTVHGKQSMLHRLHRLATVDGPARPAQLDALLRIGVALGLGAPYINGIIAVADAARLEP